MGSDSLLTPFERVIVQIKELVAEPGRPRREIATDLQTIMDECELILNSMSEEEHISSAGDDD